MKIWINDSVIILQFANQAEKVFINNRFCWDDASGAITSGGYDPKKVKKVRFLTKGKSGKLYMLRTGFLFELLISCKQEGIRVEVERDERTNFPHQKKEYKREELEKYFPFDYIEHQIEALTKALRSKTAIIKAGTGAGKCLGINTPVMMGDGSVKKVQDVKAGECVLNPYGKKIRVKSICVGKEEMFKIVPVKGNEWVCNKSHILSLKITGMEKGRRITCPLGNKYASGDIVNISIADYLKASKKFKHVAKQWRSNCLEFEEKEIPVNLEPYFLGAWLGDGNSSGTAITNMDKEIEDYIFEYVESRDYNIKIYQQEGNKAKEYYISNNYKNNILKEMHKLSLIKNKHIPDLYKLNSKKVRLEVLAGLLDTDGYYGNGYYEIIQKRKVLAEDILFLCRSLGFAAYCVEKYVKGCDYPYYRISISGELDEIPCKIERKKPLKRKQKKDVLMTGIKIESIGVDNYYGFELEGNDKLFLLGDFTVTHNTEIMLSFILETGLKSLVLVDNVALCEQIAERAEEAGIDGVGIWHGKKKKNGKSLTIATIGSVKSLPLTSSYDTLIIDELHVASSKGFQTFLDENPFKIKLGFSATPNKGDKLRFAKIRQHFGPIIVDIKAGEMVKAGVLAKEDIIFIPNDVQPFLDWQSSFEFGIVKNPDRNNKIARIAKHYKKNVLVLINDVKHKQGEILKDEVEREVDGVVEFISGSSTKDRAKVIKDFDAGEIDVLIATNIFNQGINIKNIEVLIMASGRKSISETLQKIGRATRTTKDKKTFKMYDFEDKGNKFLERHSKERERLYKSEGYTNIKHETPDFLD